MGSPQSKQVNVFEGHKEVDVICHSYNLVSVIHAMEDHGIKIKSKHYDKCHDEYLLTLSNVTDNQFNLLKDNREVIITQ